MTHFVYRHYDAEGQLLYVGCTKDPIARDNQHRSASPWRNLTTRLVFDGPYPKGEALGKEAQAIADEFPLHNKVAGNTIALRPVTGTLSERIAVVVRNRAATQGLTLGQLAERSGIQRNTLAGYLTAARKMPMRALFQLAMALECNPSEIAAEAEAAA